MSWLWLIAAIALGTYLFRLIGPLAGARWQPGTAFAELSEIAPVVLLVSVALVATLSGEEGRGVSVDAARIAGVAVGAWLAWRGQTMAITVVGAAATAALLRLCAA